VWSGVDRDGSVESEGPSGFKSALPTIRCMGLVYLSVFSRPQFRHLWNGDKIALITSEEDWNTQFMNFYKVYGIVLNTLLYAVYSFRDVQKKKRISMTGKFYSNYWLGCFPLKNAIWDWTTWVRNSWEFHKWYISRLEDIHSPSQMKCSVAPTLLWLLQLSFCCNTEKFLKQEHSNSLSPIPVLTQVFLILSVVVIGGTLWHLQKFL
jgi:hypothetical protein